MHVFGLEGARGVRLAIAAAGIAAAAGGAQAQALGERIYNESCSSCHGVLGDGNSLMNDYLTTPAPSLKGLAKANGGVYPLEEVVKIIDGRKDVRAHGSNMPVWGAVFTKPLVGEIPSNVTELVIKGRILALAEYIETLQD